MTSVRIESLIESLSIRFDKEWEKNFSFMENIPLYVSLSFLLIQFSLMFFGSLIDNLKSLRCTVANGKRDKKTDLSGHDIIFRNLKNKNKKKIVIGSPNVRRFESDDESDDEINPENLIITEDPISLDNSKKKVNHNYEYIKRIVKKLNVLQLDYKNQPEQEAKNEEFRLEEFKIKTKKQKTYFRALFEKYVYRNKRHFRYFFLINVFKTIYSCFFLFMLTFSPKIFTLKKL
jgi:hypothetical protein